MLKKLSLAIIALIFVMSALCIPVFADPGDNSSVESTSSISTEESTPSDDTSSGELSSGELSSGDENSDASSEENSSQFYIPDDSDYFTESLNSLGGTVTSGTITIESGTSAITVSKGNSGGDKNLFNLEELIKKWLWAPIALICICILVLVILDRIYIVKYKRMDPEVKYKAQQKALKAKAAAKQKAAKRSAESKHGRTRQDTHNDLD